MAYENKLPSSFYNLKLIANPFKAHVCGVLNTIEDKSSYRMLSFSWTVAKNILLYAATKLISFLKFQYAFLSTSRDNLLVLVLITVEANKCWGIILSVPLNMSVIIFLSISIDNISSGKKMEK